MLPLDSPRWRLLNHVYGTAEGVPECLLRLESGDGAAAMKEVWETLFHQYSLYPATFAAVPHLVRIAQRQPASQRRDLLIFIGTVAAWTEATELQSLAPDIQQWFEESLQQAPALVIDTLLTDSHDGLNLGYLLQALAALRGCRQLSKVLDGFSSDEFIAICPSCRRELYIWPEGDGRLTAAADDPVFRAETPRTTIEPRAGELPPWNGNLECHDCFTWLSHLALRCGHPVFARSLASLFGSAICPACQKHFDLMPRLLASL